MLNAVDADRFKKAVEVFLQTRRSGICDCVLKYFKIDQLPGINGVQMAAEWLCEKCAQELVEMATTEFFDITGVELGFQDSSLDCSRNQLIHIDKREIELESGDKT